MHGAEEACGVTQLTINGQSLAQEWNGVDAWGSGILKTQTTPALESRDVSAVWQTSCVSQQVGNSTDEVDVLQILNFTVDRIGVNPLSRPTGFTVSFQQTQPKILRVGVVPVPDVDDGEDLPPWDESSSEDKPDAGATQEAIKAEIQQLRALRAQSREIHRQIREQRRKIRHLLHHDWRTFKTDLKSCDGIKCLLSMIWQKGPRMVHYISFHLRHPLRWHRHRPSDAFGVRPSFNSSGEHPQSNPFRSSTQPSSSTPPTPPNEPTTPLPSGSSGDAQASPISPATPIDDHYGSTHRQDFHHNLRRDSFFHTSRAVKFSGLIMSLVALFSLIYRKLRRNPRVKREWDTRREERANRAAYRRAACRYRMSTWWNRFRQPQSSGDYEEKRSLIVQQEGILESRMQTEIQGLRIAHEVVNDFIRAEEEGRLRGDPVEIDGRSIGGSSILPRYRPSSAFTPSVTTSSASSTTAPPSYDADIGNSSIADGFQYTPSATESTPDSSVVDCSPRASQDTGDIRDFLPFR